MRERLMRDDPKSFTAFVCSTTFEVPAGDEIGERFFMSEAACRRGMACISHKPHGCKLVEVRITMVGNVE